RRGQGVGGAFLLRFCPYLREGAFHCVVADRDALTGRLARLRRARHGWVRVNRAAAAEARRQQQKGERGAAHGASASVRSTNNPAVISLASSPTRPTSCTPV